MSDLNFSVPPKIVFQDNRDVTRAAKGDESVELRCKAQGDTPITVKWTKVGKNDIYFLTIST